MRNLGGSRVLVVEDDAVIAMNLAELLIDCGAQVLGPISTIKETLTFVENPGNRIDVAMLDIDLCGSKIYPVVDALADRGTKFVFVSAYSAENIDKSYRHFPLVRKPVDVQELVRAIRTV